jgi:hypothetical protein
MSENKGKAKVKAKSKSKSKSTMKSAGKNKAAVMNSRNPKKPMAISGDTMSNYAMYKKGGKVKKYKLAGKTGEEPKKKVDLGNDMSISNNVQSFFKDPSLTNAVRVGMKINPLSQAARGIVEGGFRVAKALGSEKAGKEVDKIDQEYEKNRKALYEQKRGGKVKKYKSGGSTFPDLNKDGKVTKADILKGRGVIKKKGGMIKSKSKK